MFGSNIWLLAPIFILALLLFWPFNGRGSRADKKRRNPEQNKKSPFFIKPILQLGNRPKLAAKEAVEIHFHSFSAEEDWQVQFRQQGEAQWRSTKLTRGNKISIEGHPENYRFSATLEPLGSGVQFEYKIFKASEQVFSATALTRKGRGQSQKVVIVGDLCEGGVGSRKIAYQIGKANPDLLLLAGDLVYRRGRLSEYLERFLPVYNADEAVNEKGAPILRSRLSLIEIGNHDTALLWDTDIPNFDEVPDLLAHYVIWSQALNGPIGPESKKHVPPLAGSKPRMDAFLNAARDQYPRIANFSVDAGDCHWLVLDSNCYVDWTDSQLISWVDADLSAAKDARWKIVSFHHAPFTAHWNHFDEQRMRILAPLLESHGVHLVFSGHNHTYERTYPLHFAPRPQADGKLIAANGHVDGEFQFDKSYDGKKNTKANGIIYVVTGGGGARQKLMSAHPDGVSAEMPPYTVNMVDSVHSFTTVDMTGDKLVIKQISEDGELLDEFVVTQ